MICSSLNRFFTSNLPPRLDSKSLRYSKQGGVAFLPVRLSGSHPQRPLVEGKVIHIARGKAGLRVKTGLFLP
jgi:hypothetical protein